MPAARRIRESLPLLPFFALVTIFLIIPTVTVIVSSVYADGVFSFARIQALFSGTALSALAKSVLLSGSTAPPYSGVSRSSPSWSSID